MSFIPIHFGIYLDHFQKKTLLHLRPRLQEPHHLHLFSPFWQDQFVGKWWENAGNIVKIVARTWQ